MKRHFFISNNLDDLETIEQELEDGGFSSPQFHILSQNDAEVDQRHLHGVEAVLKKDVVRSMELGALIGMVAAVIVLSSAYMFGWTQTAAGWMPFIFLSIIVLGFCTWEGGLFGIQEPHYQFKRFDNALKRGKHVFFVDVTKLQEGILMKIAGAHPELKPAGEGESSPEWIIKWQNNWRGFIKTMP
jgi:hypothetical protein